MKQNPIDDEQLRSYLLGDLPEVEEDLLEQRLLTEEESFDLLEALEAELLAAVSRGELPPAESEKILRRLASSPQGRERLALARSLNTLADSRVQRPPAPVVVPFTRRLVQSKPPWAALAAAVLVTAIGVSWVVQHRPEPPLTSISQTRTPPAPPLPTPTPPEPSPAPDTASHTEKPSDSVRPPEPVKFVIDLALMTVRGSEKTPVEKFEIPTGTQIAELQLRWEGLDVFASFDVEIRPADQGTVDSEPIRHSGLKPRGESGEKVLVLDIPVYRLPDGRYEVAVKPEGEAEETLELDIVHEKR